jgi:hypothetical protein
MTLRKLITISCLFTLMTAPACDVDVDGSAELEESLLGDEDGSLPASDLVDDADADAADDDAREWTPEEALDLADPTPSHGGCQSSTWYHWIENACGSCSPQPNMPGSTRNRVRQYCVWCPDTGWKCDSPIVVEAHCDYC